MKGLISDEQFADVKREMLADIVARRREQEQKGLGPSPTVRDAGGGGGGGGNGDSGGGGGGGLRKRSSRANVGVSLDSVCGPSAEEKRRAADRAKHFSALVKAANARTLHRDSTNHNSNQNAQPDTDSNGKVQAASPLPAAPSPIETKPDDHEFANLEDVFADEATRLRTVSVRP